MTAPPSPRARRHAGAMTAASTRRAQGRARARRHRALRRRGRAAYCVRAHVERLAAALIKSGMPDEETWCRDKVEAALDGLVEEWVVRKLRE
jgi:hypothetical protein